MTALITLTGIATYLTLLITVWRWQHRKELEARIQRNKSNGTRSGVDGRWYIADDLHEARWRGVFTGIFWWVTIPVETVIWTCHRLGVTLEIVPPTEKKRRAEQAAQLAQQAETAAREHSQRLEREHGLASLDLLLPTEPSLGNPTTVEAFRRDHP